MIRITKKEYLANDPDNAVITTLNMRGCYEIPISILVLYGGYKLINYIFKDKKKKKDETE